MDVKDLATGSMSRCDTSHANVTFQYYLHSWHTVEGIDVDIDEMKSDALSLCTADQCRAGECPRDGASDEP